MSQEKADAPSVVAHLGMLQAIITRLANNSANCKTWSVTIQSALLVVAAEKSKAEFAAICAVSIIAFGGLDAYYLTLERSFREAYNRFVGRIANRENIDADLYRLSPAGGRVELHEFSDALVSWSVLPFYLSLAAVAFMVFAYIRGS